MAYLGNTTPAAPVKDEKGSAIVKLVLLGAGALWLLGATKKLGK